MTKIEVGKIYKFELNVPATVRTITQEVITTNKVYNNEVTLGLLNDLISVKIQRKLLPLSDNFSKIYIQGKVFEIKKIFRDYSIILENNNDFNIIIQ